MGAPPRGGTHHVVKERSPPTPSASDGRGHSENIFIIFLILTNTNYIVVFSNCTGKFVLFDDDFCN